MKSSMEKCLWCDRLVDCIPKFSDLPFPEFVNKLTKEPVCERYRFDKRNYKHELDEILGV